MKTHVEALAAELVDPANRREASDVLAAPPSAGIYAWWSGAPEVMGVVGSPGRDGYLFYVGIASARTGLRKRLATHVNGTARRSTLRLTLAAIGVGSGTVTRSGRSKVSLDVAYETAITTWIRDNFTVSWVAAAEAHLIERSVIGLLAPPLNSAFKSHHAAYATVRNASAALRARAQSL